MKNQTFRLYTFLLLILCCCTISFGDDIDSILKRNVTTFSVTSTPLLKTIQKFMKEHKVRICFEEIPYDEDTVDKNVSESEIKSLNLKMRKPISINISGKTVRDVLDAITTEDTNYTWDIGNEQVINIIPKDSTDTPKGFSSLDFMVPAFDYQSVPFGTIVMMTKPDSTGKQSFGQTLIDHKFYVYYIKSGFVSDTVSQLISVNVDHSITAREFLNKVMKTMGAKFYWYMKGTSFPYNKTSKPTDKTLTFGEAF